MLVYGRRSEIGPLDFLVRVCEEAVSDRAARDGRDPANLSEQAGVGHEAQNPEGAERRSEAAARKRECEGGLLRRRGREGGSALDLAFLDEVVRRGADRRRAERRLLGHDGFRTLKSESTPAQARDDRRGRDDIEGPSRRDCVQTI